MRRYALPLFALLALLATLSGIFMLDHPASAGSIDDVTARFDSYITAQNDHDLKAVEAHLVKSEKFLWLRGNVMSLGTEAALAAFGEVHKGTWKMTPVRGDLKAVEVSAGVVQVVVPIVVTAGAKGAAATDSLVLVTQIYVKSGNSWRIASIVSSPMITG
jgi:hypothetical protein